MQNEVKNMSKARKLFDKVDSATRTVTDKVGSATQTVTAKAKSSTNQAVEKAGNLSDRAGETLQQGGKLFKGKIDRLRAKSVDYTGLDEQRQPLNPLHRQSIS
jgi:hypothetical protein